MTAIAAVLAAPAASPAQTSGTVTYRYDANGRLVVMNAPSDMGTAAYQYDAVDNRTRWVSGIGNLPPLPGDDDMVVPATGTSPPLPVLDNDVEPNNDPITIVSATNGVGGGAVNIAPDHKTLTYTQPSTPVSADSFTYVVTDGALQATGNVKVHVGAIAPSLIAGSDNLSVSSLITYTVPVLDNDKDPAANNTNTYLTIFGATNGTYGNVAILSGGKSLTYTPTTITGWTTDSFTYSIHNPAGATAVGQVHVTFGAGTVTAQNDTYTVHKPGSQSIPVLGNDTNSLTGDSSGLLVTRILTQGRGQANVPGDQRSVYYVPDTTSLAPDTFTYEVKNAAGAVGQATVNVTYDVPLPVANPDGPIAVHAYAGCTNCEASVDTYSNDSPDTVFDQLIGALHGTVNQNPLNGNVYLSYAPHVNPVQPGADSFQYRVRDAWGRKSDYTTVSINVIDDTPPPKADAPDFSFTAPYYGTFTIPVYIHMSHPGTLDGVSAGSCGGNPTIGSDSNGFYYLTYTAANNCLVDQLSYHVSNSLGQTDSGLITLSIPAPPSSIHAEPDGYYSQIQLNGRGPLTIHVLANDTAGTNGQISISDAGQPLQGTATISGSDIIYNYTGIQSTSSDNWNYTITDGQTTSTATIYVSIINGVSTNHDPVAIPYNTAQNPITVAPGGRGSMEFVLNGDYDPDFDTIYLDTVIPRQGAQGHAVVTNTQFGQDLSYYPDNGATGIDSFDYRILDGHGGSAIATVWVQY